MNTDFAAKTDGITSSTFLSFQVDVFFKKNFHFIQNLIRKRMPSRFHCIADPEQIAIEAIMKAFRKMEHNLVASPTESTGVRSYCIIVAKHLSMNAGKDWR